MNNETKLKNILTANPEVMAVLEAAATLPLPDCWVSAGLIRNRVWDALYSVHSEMNDIDVIYFDATDCSVETEKHWERVLYERFPEHPWSVKNQARMHEKNQLAPFTSSFDGVAHFTEIPTAIAARIHEGKLEIMAPHGLDDLFAGIVKPTPTFQAMPFLAIYKKRIQQKQWQLIWTLLTIA
ncbi:nucleotidyltransferase family protein [Kurthia sp. Dielmo]|uniref:nucleotidyltransferase family protein n=1 Tax=Kurthia sp. Dielmo TaxID=1033738 RepID=UPI002106A6E0|nr:nucleotidyltransferase family protein [Kurthia sp. Dielmo]